MRSFRPPAPTRLLILAFLAVSMTGCAGTRPMRPILAALDCRPYLEPLRPRTPAIPRPAAETVGQVLAFADGQTAQLDEANRRGDTILAVVDICQARQGALLEALTPKPWWKRLWKG